MPLIRYSVFRAFDADKFNKIAEIRTIFYCINVISGIQTK